MDINERLRIAAKRGDAVELKALLRDPGCDALAKDIKGMAALMYAVYYGHEACVRILMPVSDALAKNENGQTALMHAARYGYEGCVRLLLPESDVLAKDEAGRTSSYWAKSGSHESLARFLEACELSLSEQASIEVAASSGALRKRAAPRV